MTSPLLRLFAVCWWVVVIGSVSFALFGTWAVWGHYHSSEAYGQGEGAAWRGMTIVERCCA